tara:strand:- start:1020 stop:1274 length:255 start_codon:yes stop_codon:yes gene_type:complete
MFIFHESDLDRSSQLNKVHSERYGGDANNVSKKFGSHSPVIPVYTNDLSNVRRASDSRHRVLEDRRQAQFNNQFSDFKLGRPLN